MKRRWDCTCPCHVGGVAVHVVPCCDGMPLGWINKLKSPRKNAKRPRKSPAKRSPAA
jgi:hypothetical protein